MVVFLSGLNSDNAEKEAEVACMEGGVFRGKAYIVNKVFTIMLFLCHLICDAAVLSSGLHMNTETTRTFTTNLKHG